jgi:hypothetical protein
MCLGASSGAPTHTFVAEMARNQVVCMPVHKERSGETDPVGPVPAAGVASGPTAGGWKSNPPVCRRQRRPLGAHAAFSDRLARPATRTVRCT